MKNTILEIKKNVRLIVKYKVLYNKTYHSTLTRFRKTFQIAFSACYLLITNNAFKTRAPQNKGVTLLNISTVVS